MEKYFKYAKVMNEMIKLYNQLRKMEDGVIAELRKGGFTQDVVSKMMAISKGRVNQRCRLVLKEKKVRK